MNQEIKQRWVAALRSGQYKQGRYMLRSKDDCFCCLGVLCDLMVKDGKAEWTALTSICKGGGIVGEGYSCRCGETELSGNVPGGVRDLVGIEDVFLLLKDDEGENEFVALLNDEYQYDFTKLADLIEQQL